MAREVKKLKTKLKGITESLRRIVECPICLDTIKIPFKTCGTGHGVCSSCCGGLNKCPTCQDAFAKENPICLKNLIEALPRECLYSNDGCEEIVEQGNDHEEFCGYRPIVCKVIDCRVKVPLTKLMDHYKTDHPDYFICKKISESIIWPSFNPKEERENYFPILLFRNIFWLITKNDEEKKRLRFTFQATPIEKLEKDYFVKIKLKSGNFVYTSTIKCSISSSCEFKEDDSDADEEYSMHVPQNVLHKFIDSEGDLNYTILFFEEDKSISS